MDISCISKEIIMSITLIEEISGGFGVVVDHVQPGVDLYREIVDDIHPNLMDEIEKNGFDLEGAYSQLEDALDNVRKIVDFLTIKEREYAV